MIFVIEIITRYENMRSSGYHTNEKKIEKEKLVLEDLLN